LIENFLIHLTWREKMKKILLGLSMIAVLAIPSMGAHILCGGNVPLINNIVGVGVITLDFTSSGTAQEIAKFIVNNNSTGFDINWTFANSGNFVNSQHNQLKIPMDKIQLGRGIDLTSTVSGTGINLTSLGATGTIFDDAYAYATGPTPNALGNGLDITALATTTGIAGQYDTGLITQSTASVDVPLEMTCDWTSSVTVLAGLYMESITFTIAATL
jgi:hypothetical protein